MKKKILIILLVILAFGAFKFFGLNQYFTLEYIKENQNVFAKFYAENTVLTSLVYFVIYIISTALSIPGATVLTLLGGAIFGLGYGLLLISFASSIGATLAFLLSRTLLRETVEKKFASKIKKLNQGVEKEGAFYLFTLRLVPIFPFFLINLGMGLTRLKTVTFYAVSQLGMLPGTAVYVNAGVQLSQIDSLKGIISFDVLGSFVLLGLFPIIGKKFVEFLNARKVYKDYKKPKHFDYNMVVIGAGSAGLVTAYISAAIKSKVALIEKNKMGGDCLNTGCVPSKALIKSAKVKHQIEQAQKYGVNVEGKVSVDFAKAMERVQNVISKIEPHDSVERYTDLGVECISGSAKIISPWEVEVNGKVLTTKNITIATGASPFVPSIKGIENIDILVSENLWNIRELPNDLIVLGAGPIGLEMAQSFNRFGSNVTVIEMGERILSKEDTDVASLATDFLRAEGVNIYTQHKAVEFIKRDDKDILVCDFNGERKEFSFDKVLVAVGRKANIKGFGAEELGIRIRNNGTIEANEYLQTNFPNIYVCGDVTGPFQLTHTASHQAWYCAVNAHFSPLKKFKVDYSVIPWVTYLDPEVATVGKNELQLQTEDVPYDITKYGIDDLDRAIADGSDHGFVKVLTKKGSDKILGATIIGVGAGELITEFVTNMKHEKGLNAILGTIHSYPTMSEANKFAAGNWKRANAPEKALQYLMKFHKWRRS
tara:strand:- start:129031 stop:131166 length:2136 start_codon:yes stop_codon:yes gene_type:complete